MQRVTTADITSGKARLPFTSRSKWLGIQADCQDLQRTHSHLIQGTRQSKKVTNAKDVKRYLNVATIARDGLLVVKRNDPLSPTRECIMIHRTAKSPRRTGNGPTHSTRPPIFVPAQTNHASIHVRSRPRQVSRDHLAQLSSLCFVTEHPKPT